LKEMTANVDWQESERDARVAEYKLQEAKEVEEEGERKEASFMDKFAKEAYGSTTSIADRINKNRHYVQRTAADLDKSSFTR